MRYCLLLLLVGCVTTEWGWRNPDGVENFKVDWYECERDARVTSQHGRGLLSGATVSVDEEFRHQCMESRGWSYVEKKSKK